MKKKLKDVKGEIHPVVIIGGVFVVIFLIILVWILGTQSGKRMIVDLKSDLGGGLERVINVYTANGDKIATYKGKIDIEESVGGYIKFDFDGKRYIYYNCFVETIADIP